MAVNLNQLQLIGNLTRDPELKQAANGSSVTSFSLALNRSFKDGSGEWQEATDFVDVVAWGKTAEQIQERINKGTRVLVIGRLQSSSWTDTATGKNRSKLEVLAFDVTIIEKTQSTQSKDVVLTADDIDESKPIDLSEIPF